jgi:hypothetical protein
MSQTNPNKLLAGSNPTPLSAMLRGNGEGTPEPAPRPTGTANNAAVPQIVPEQGSRGGRARGRVSGRGRGRPRDRGPADSRATENRVSKNSTRSRSALLGSADSLSRRVTRERQLAATASDAASGRADLFAEVSSAPTGWNGPERDRARMIQAEIDEEERRTAGSASNPSGTQAGSPHSTRPPTTVGATAGASSSIFDLTDAQLEALANEYHRKPDRELRDGI